jgi:hypothetical protein
VFTAEEQMEAQLNLDTIAAAGGTTSAFVIDTGGQVTEEFTEAMNQVRMNAKSCEFELVPSGDPIVWTDVWVRITSDMGDGVWVARVDGAAQCSAGSPGFYYDTPVGQGQIPNRIILCPSACALINDDPGQVIEVFSTCDDPPDP